jgi:hypothetical protein
MTRQYTGNIEHKYVLKETAVQVEQSKQEPEETEHPLRSDSRPRTQKGVKKRGSFFVHIKTRSLNLGKTHSRSV